MENLNLKPGEMMLVSARGVEGNKVQLEFAQLVQLETTSVSLVSILNQSDDRFGSQKPRHAWISGERADIKATFGINVDTLQKGETLELGILNPTINGMPLNIQIVETVDGSEYEVANFETKAKRAGKDGEFIYHKGMHIYVRTSVVVGEPKHFIYKETSRTTESTNVSDSVKEALGE